jgi:hypothetical protein
MIVLWLIRNVSRGKVRVGPDGLFGLGRWLRGRCECPTEFDFDSVIVDSGSVGDTREFRPFILSLRIGL